MAYFNVKAERVNSLTRGMLKKFEAPEVPENLSSFMRHCLSCVCVPTKKRKSGSSGSDSDEEPHIKCTVNEIVVRRESESVVPPLQDIMVVPKEILYNARGEYFTGIYYTSLMTHDLEGKKTAANIIYGTNPMVDVYLHNNLLIPDRTTSAAAPHWILDMVVGPFPSLEKAILCGEELVDHTRGKESKRRKARLLSKIYNVNLYSSAVKSSDSLDEFLEQYAPPTYSQRYQELMAQRIEPKKHSRRSSKSKSGGKGHKKKASSTL